MRGFLTLLSLQGVFIAMDLMMVVISHDLGVLIFQLMGGIYTDTSQSMLANPGAPTASNLLCVVIAAAIEKGYTLLTPYICRQPFCLSGR